MIRLTRKPRIQSVTSLPPSPEEDRARRFRQYTIAMLIRTGCVVLAVITSGPIQWLAILGAVFLPYFAVVSANASGAPDQPNQPQTPVAAISEPSQR